MPAAVSGGNPGARRSIGTPMRLGSIRHWSTALANATDWQLLGTAMRLGHLYTSFQGRISRAMGWLGGIILGVVTLAALFAATFVVGISFDGNDSRLKFVIFALQLAFLYPSAALMV